MKKFFGRVKKAIVLAGGTGGRLSLLTGGLRNKVNVEVHRKPLISYLLSTLGSLGITEIGLVIRPDHENEFAEMIESGKYPKLRYSLIHTPFRESGYRTSLMLAKVFRDTAIQSFAGRQPAIVAFGDTYYFPHFIKRALADFNAKGRTLFLAGPEHTVLPYEEAFHEKVVESGEFLHQKLQPAFAGFISTQEFFHFFSEKLTSNRSLLNVLTTAHTQGLRSAIIHGQLINLNTPIDYIALREVLAGRLRFPHPPNWVRRYKQEIESITQRRLERRDELKEKRRNQIKHRRL